MSSIMKSAALIKSIKRRGFIPESQETFTNDDFLEMATEKINIKLMSQLMEARGDYLVYHEDIPLVEGIQEYTIPNRAHGDKLREASIVDSNGKTVRELTQIEMDELSDYHSDYSTYTHLTPFYLQNNTLVLIATNYAPDTFIRMYFYLRPNKLVLEARAATAATVVSSTEVDTIAPLSGTITNIAVGGIITSASHGLTSGDKVVIAGTDSTPSLNGTQTVTVIDANTFSVPVSVTIAGTIGSFDLAADVTVISSVNFPKHFVSDLLFDIVSHTSPNKIKIYNIAANSVNNSLKTLSFRTSDITKNNIVQIVKGNFITSAEETIVPNIPTEFHPLLAQMVSVMCMEGMADEAQKKSANDTLKEMERDILKIITNRVEGAPKKIKNRNGTLQATFRNKRRM